MRLLTEEAQRKWPQCGGAPRPSFQSLPITGDETGSYKLHTQSEWFLALNKIEQKRPQLYLHKLRPSKLTFLTEVYLTDTID
jgi:hypothetical protein